MSTDKKVFTLSGNESPEQFVIRRMAEAAITLNRLPDRSYRQTFSRYWPQTVNTNPRMDRIEKGMLDEERDDRNVGSGAYRQTRVIPQRSLPSYISPKPREIDEMDETLPWLFLLENETTRRIVAMRSVVHYISLKPKFGWNRIAEIIGCSAFLTKRCYDDGICNIAKKLKFKSNDNVKKADPRLNAFF
jgi:hypothetical protein